MTAFRITCGACGLAHDASSQAELRAFQVLHNEEHGRAVEFELARGVGADTSDDQRQAG